MHEAVLRNTQDRKEQLISEFYVDVIRYINERIAEVCQRALAIMR